ncbi:two-component system, cell cycle sensor histidine kinase PleC [Azospirillaceae bacterium]
MKIPFFSVRRQLAISVALVHALLMSAFIVDMVARQRTQLQDVNFQQAVVLAEVLAANSVSWVLANDLSGLEEVIYALSHNPELRYAMILSKDGRVLAHSENARVGSYLTDSISERLFHLSRSTSERRPETLVINPRLVDVAAPILFQNRVIGWARVGLNRDQVAAAVRRAVIGGVVYTISAISIGTFLAFAIAGRLTRRLNEMSRVSERIYRGERALRVTEDDRDELGILGKAYNAMLSAVETSEKALLTEQLRLRASEERFNLAVEGSRDAIWDWRFDTGESYYSPRWRELLQSSDLSILQASTLEQSIELWLMRFHPQNQPEMRVCLDSLRLGSVGCCDKEGQIQRADGSWIWVASSALAQLNSQGQIIRIVGVVSDISVRKRYEAELKNARASAEKSSQAKSDFLAKMSHELRTPLNSILGFSEIIRDELLGEVGVPHYKEYAQHINDSGAHLLNLINDILDLSKIEAGKITIEKEFLDLESLARGVEVLVRQRAYKNRLRITSLIPHTLPTLWADQRAIKQILFNLLANAIKFTPEGGEITIAACEEPNGFIAISVADTGIGIPEDHIERLLKPFEQIDNRYANAEIGVGLGLSLVQGLVVLHDGRLSIESVVGKGTVVTVYFPLASTLSCRQVL